MFIPPPSPEFYTRNTKKPHTVPNNEPGFEHVLKRNLFNVPLEAGARLSGPGALPEEEEEARLLAELDKLPISKQGWNLQGTIVNSFLPQESRAILVVDGRQGAYGKDAQIKGWRLAHIDRRLVVIERNGRRERLLVGGREVTTPAPEPARVTLSGHDIEKALNDIPGLMRQGGFAPGQKDGVYGLNVTFVQPDGIFSRLGLRQNDLLTEANGQTLTSLGDLARLGNIARQDKLRLQVLRDGQNIVLEYDIGR